jgi:hypothetical protein
VPPPASPKRSGAVERMIMTKNYYNRNNSVTCKVGNKSGLYQKEIDKVSKQ